MPLVINNMGCLLNHHVHRRLYKYMLLTELFGKENSMVEFHGAKIQYQVTIGP